MKVPAGLSITLSFRSAMVSYLSATSVLATRGPLPMSVRSGVYVFVDDVDAHCASVRSAGVQIVSELVELPFGDRMYLAVDHEGHEWYFAQHVRDVSLAELEGA